MWQEEKRPHDRRLIEISIGDDLLPEGLAGSLVPKEVVKVHDLGVRRIRKLNADMLGV